jgi:hypothetical protein
MLISGSIAPPFLTWQWVEVSGQFHAMVTLPKRMLGGPQSWSGCCGVQKTNFCAVSIPMWKLPTLSILINVVFAKRWYEFGGEEKTAYHC